MLNVNVVSEPAAAIKPERYFWDIDLPTLTKYDENLVKPALLVADRVQLTSFRQDMLAMVRSDAFKNTQMPMRYIHRFAWLSLEPDPVELQILQLSKNILCSKEDAKRFLEASPEDKIEHLREFGQKYSENIFEMRVAIGKILRQRWSDLTSTKLSLANERGLLDVTGWYSEEPLSEFELSWLAQEEYLTAAIESLVNRIDSDHNITLLDTGTQLALSPLLPKDSLALTRSPHATALHHSTNVAVALTAQLPGLNELEIDEILDLRNDLSNYLPAFRSSIALLSDEIAAEPETSPSILGATIQRHWERDIAPALQEIHSQVSRASFPKNLLAALAEDKTAVASSGSSIVLAAGSIFAGLSTLIPAAAAAAYPFIRALNKTVVARDEARQNHLYFLYEVQRATKHRKR